MHVIGLPDIMMQRSDDNEGEVIIEVIRYLCRDQKPVGHGHVVAGEAGSWFQLLATDGDQLDLAGPMRNPFGRLKLVRFKDVAKRN